MSHLQTAIFGPGLSGKTTLARFMSRKNFIQYKVETLALDPIGTDWGSQAKTFDFTQEEDFWRSVWETRGKIIIVDEAAETINRRQDLIPAFTRIRHNGHKLIVIGHRGAATLLPIMRDQISTIYLFKQTEKACEVWVEQFVEPRIREATKLKQFYFLRAELFGDVMITKLSPEELAV